MAEIYYDVLIGVCWYQCKMTVFNPPKPNGQRWTLKRTDFAAMLRKAKSDNVANSAIRKTIIAAIVSHVLESR